MIARPELSRGRSSKSPPDSTRSFALSCRHTAAASPLRPSPYTESRSKYGLRAFGAVRGLVGIPQSGRRVERHIVVEKLTEKGHAGSMCIAVRVSDIEGGIDNERDGTGGEVVARIHEAPAFTEFAQRRLDRRCGRRKRRQVKQASEPVSRRAAALRIRAQPAASSGDRGEPEGNDYRANRTGNRIPP